MSKPHFSGLKKVIFIYLETTSPMPESDWVSKDNSNPIRIIGTEDKKLLTIKIKAC